MMLSEDLEGPGTNCDDWQGIDTDPQDFAEELNDFYDTIVTVTDEKILRASIQMKCKESVTDNDEEKTVKEKSYLLIWIV